MRAHPSQKRRGSLDAAIGRRVRARRAALGWTQAALAEALGVSQQLVQKYETGATPTSSARLYEIAGLLEAPVAEFFPDAPGGEASEEVRALVGLAADYRAIADGAVRSSLRAILRALAERP